MGGFSKLHSSLTASSLWNEPDKTRIVFITMLSMADSNGDVKASVVGLAHQARESLNDTEKALSTLLAPDPHSGRKEMDGRRAVVIDGGWHLVTHQFYRELGMSNETKTYWRDKKRAQRSKRVPDSPRHSRKGKDSLGTLVSASGSGSDSEKNGDSKGKPKDREEVISYVRELGLPETDGHYYFDKWQAGGFVNAGKPIRDWRALIRSHKAAGYLPSQKRGIQSSSFQKPMSIFEIEKRLDAARGTLDNLKRSQPLNEDRKPKWREKDIPERDRLYDLIKDLKQKMIQ